MNKKVKVTRLGKKLVEVTKLFTDRASAIAYAANTGKFIVYFKQGAYYV